MKSPCPECAASSVWVGVAKVTRERGGSLLMRWRCGLCKHEWCEETARPKPLKASVRPRRRRKTM